MLLNPKHIHQDLLSTLSFDKRQKDDTPHTALLIGPQGQLVCWTTNKNQPFSHDPQIEGEQQHERNEDITHDGAVANGEEDGQNEDRVHEEEKQYVDEEEEEPYLEDPERLRLILGLASQWEEDASPRVECETQERE
ncbi:hypothetical protein TREMEDRAFT_61824 [Tremella mesenterica DSM 1558]|uniref:uncharacterized protein n=1 Tax=Tremella mesenterica (strain ATCC 24925 / CBS 8224 / DSM 1558 / NBRC 9311 / NRRL Y-6157 / RJB 2259-6 / UBC 559-6) TaxID=578456 RepID=UPI0003F4A238|nr:uncharacterized protein TREMEDRAFT_61824 [Tremella mesenterica DSM 1558]EIW70062.1 hypothetical protein TREMEDRAFT_61824 [Tremella mesenterica DSM 1558]